MIRQTVSTMIIMLEYLIDVLHDASDSIDNSTNSDKDHFFRNTYRFHLWSGENDEMEDVEEQVQYHYNKDGPQTEGSG